MDSTVPTFPADKICTTLRLATPADDDKEAQFKCEYCPRTFKTVRGRCGHQTAHRHLWAPPVNKKPRIDPPPAPAWSSAPIWASSSDAIALGSAWRHGNLLFTHYYPWAYIVPPSMPWQTGIGLAPAQPSSAVLARVAGGYRGTGDGGHHGHWHGLPEMNQEETADGVDLTLKL